MIDFFSLGRLSQFGADVFPNGLPIFITYRLRDLIYQLLRHPQLTIREFAIKVFSAYLSCSAFEVSRAWG
jgi:hypothetical protein